MRREYSSQQSGMDNRKQLSNPKRKAPVMLASAIHYNKSAVGRVSVPAAFVRHLNANTLALALFVALALLTAARGKEPETTVSVHARGPESQLTITPCHVSITAQRQIQGDKFNVKNFWE
jgi:hypothetical protein